MELKTTQDYFEAAIRRKWWIVIPFVMVMLGAVAVYKKLPKVYSAATLILVQPQEIPDRYVQSTVTQSVSGRLATISQQILSRTSLEKVIRELNLVDDFTDPLLMSKHVRSMRNAIRIDVHRGGGRSTSSFSISYEDQDPVRAAGIVNRIASLFITENLKVREEQARGTSQFLKKELLEIEQKLEIKEDAIRRFKEENMGELPSQLDANLRILERLQDQFRTNNESIISAVQRKAGIESQIDQISKEGPDALTQGGTVPQDPLLAQLRRKRMELQELELQYTDQHPDIIALKASIEQLEAKFARRKEAIPTVPQKMTPITDPTLRRLNQELRSVLAQIDKLLRDQANLKDQIALYRRRVETAPKTEEALSTLLRDYGLLQENYRSMLSKKIQAQLAENLERRQKAEQFKILDPATPPTYPGKPDAKRFFGLALLVAVGFGGGLAYVKEQMDRSFYTDDEIEQVLGFPVIASIPTIERGTGRRSQFCSVETNQSNERATGS